MSSRRTRTPRARKGRSPEAPQNDVALVTGAPSADAVAQLARTVDASETAQLRALEAGWDELLS